MARLMDHIMRVDSEQGKIEALYSLIAMDAKFLDKIDEIPFVETPLHRAAAAGHTEFAMEMMMLKPSFGRKLNRDGFTPLLLAVHNDKNQLVSKLLHVHKDLVCAQGRGGMNPLHYAAQTGNLFLLGRILAICPKCIEDVTSRSETALHIALKYDKLDAFKLLVGWLRRAWFKNALFWERRILNWQDLDGNSVLHFAAIQNKTEVVRCLLDCKGLFVNDKNSGGCTTLDIVQGQTQVGNQEMIRNMLCRAGAKNASSVPNFPSFEDYLRSPVSISEKSFITFFRQRMLISNDLRNILLVVAVLLVTVAYQAILSPPGGFWQDNYIPGTNNEFNITAATSASNEVGQVPHRVGTVTMTRQFFRLLLDINTLTFYIPVLLIILVLPPGLPKLPNALLTLSFGLLFLSYGTSISITAPLPSNWFHYFLFFSFFLVSNIAVVFVVISKNRKVLTAFFYVEKTDWPTFHYGWYDSSQSA